MFKVKSKPTKRHLTNYEKLINNIKLAKADKLNLQQERFENKERNKILLRLMHLGNKKAGYSFPIEIRDSELKDGNIWHSYDVSVVDAYTKLQKELNKNGFKAKVEIGETRKDGDYYTARTISLTVLGLKG